MPAYASATDLAARKDIRTIADLASDSGTPVADITTDPNVAAALADASGRLEGALLVGNMYEISDLENLTDNSLAMLKRIVCDIAMAELYNRRPNYGEEGEKAIDIAEKWLDKLQSGMRVFNVSAQEDAGDASIEGPSACTYAYLNLLPDRTRNFYPSRGQRLPLGRGGP